MQRVCWIDHSADYASKVWAAVIYVFWFFVIDQRNSEEFKMEQIFLKRDSSMKSALVLAVSLVISIFICMIGNFALHSSYFGIIYQPEFSICRPRIHISWFALLVLAHTLRLAFESVLRLRSRVSLLLPLTSP